MNNLDIEIAARNYIGTPFRHQGRTKWGLDCVGLIIKVAHDLNITDFDYTNYTEIPDSKEMRYYLNKYMFRIPTNMQQAGDIFYMSFTKTPQHLAIYTSTNTIIHSASVFKGVIEQSFSKYWKSKTKEIYRFRR